MMENQKLLQQKYQEEMNSVNEDFFEDTTFCDVCGSRKLKFVQKQNGVGRECLDCDRYMKWAENNMTPRPNNFRDLDLDEYDCRT